MKYYTLTTISGKHKTRIRVQANDSGHAQAQAEDICRGLDINSYTLEYGDYRETHVSKLFSDLAANNFTHKQCYIWQGPLDNKEYPCMYIHKQRIYVRHVILKYLDTPREACNIRLTCDNRCCVNPYHFDYVDRKNEKLSGGDRKLLLAYLGQGASVKQVAKVFNVDPTTIYRHLEHERFHPRTPNHS